MPLPPPQPASVNPWKYLKMISKATTKKKTKRKTVVVNHQIFTRDADMDVDVVDIQDMEDMDFLHKEDTYQLLLQHQ